MCGDDPEPPAGMPERMCMYGEWVGGKCVRAGFYEGFGFWKEHFWAQPHLSPLLADIFMCFFELGHTEGHGEERYAIAKAAGLSMRDEIEKFQLYSTEQGCHMPNNSEGPWGVVKAGADSYSGEKPRNHEPGELLGFVSGREARAAGWVGRTEVAPFGQDFFLGDDDEAPTRPRKVPARIRTVEAARGACSSSRTTPTPCRARRRFRTTTPRATRRPS